MNLDNSSGILVSDGRLFSREQPFREDPLVYYPARPAADPLGSSSACPGLRNSARAPTAKRNSMTRAIGFWRPLGSPLRTLLGSASALDSEVHNIQSHAAWSRTTTTSSPLARRATKSSDPSRN